MSKKTTAVSNYHAQYVDVTTQHYDPRSERFAGGDQLLTALANRWEVERCVLLRYAFAGRRYSKVYEFTLRRADDVMIMPVIDNPYIKRIVDAYEIELLEAEQDQDAAAGAG
jgi:hypothetical protein